MTSWPRGGEGGRQKLTIVHKPMYYVVKRVTRGREGVKNDEKSSDVICECPLLANVLMYTIVYLVCQHRHLGNQEGKSKIAQNEKRQKNYIGFLIHTWNIGNFWSILLRANLSFLKSGYRTIIMPNMTTINLNFKSADELCRFGTKWIFFSWFFMQRKFWTGI